MQIPIVTIKSKALATFSALESRLVSGLRLLGYSFETRHWGDQKLGFWSLKLKKSAKSPKKIVICPGWGDSPLTWQPVLINLLPQLLRSEITEIIILDFPGYRGALKTSPAFPSWESLRDRTVDLLRQIQPQTIIGFSLGGWLSCEYALSQSEAPRKKLIQLMLVNPSGVGGPPAWHAEFVARLKMIVSNKGKGYLDLVAGPKSPRNFFFEHVVETFFEKAETIQLLDSIKETDQLDERLSQISVPVHFFWADSDRLFPKDILFEYWNSRLKEQATLDVISEAGHNVYIESPRQLARALKKYI